MTPAEYAAYQRAYYQANKRRLLKKRKETRKADPTYKRRARQYVADWRVRQPPAHPVPKAERRPEQTAPFHSPYGIYGMTAKSYPPSTWEMFSDAVQWGIE